MDDFDNKHFIGEIKIRPSLWDRRVDGYRDKHKKQHLWREVYSAVYPDYDRLSLKDKELVGEELQTKWKGLRDCYVRYLRNTRIKKGLPQKHVREYIYAPVLEFLRPVCRVHKSGFFTRKLNSKVQITVNNNLNEGFDKEELENYCDGDNKVDDNSVFLIQNPKEINSIEKGRPYIINMFSKNIKTSMESVNSMDSCEQEETTVAHETTDDDMDFFRSLLPFIKSLPLYQKISFRADIMKIAKEYADNLEKSNAPSVETLSLSSTSFVNSPFQQQMYLPVLPMQSLPFHTISSNKKSSIENNSTSSKLK